MLVDFSLHLYKKILISSVVCILTSFNMNANEYQINYLSVKDGLSQNEVTSIYRDKHGFMWFGTRGGLNRYDGYEFKHYKPLSSQNSLRNPSIERIYGDKKGNIWIGTKSGGFSVYGILKERFYHAKDSLNQFPNRVISFCKDSEGNNWMGSWNNGLYQLNEDNKYVNSYLGKSRVSSIVETEDGTIWCGTSNGLRYLNNENGFKYADLKFNNPEITEIVKDPNGPYLWIVGWGINLIKYNYKDFTYQQYKLPESEGARMTSCYSLMQDNTGKLWVGTWGHGLFQFNSVTETFKQINIKPRGAVNSNIDYDVILDIYEDKVGDIWLGTDGGGVVRLSQKSRFKNFNSLPKSKISKRHINAILVDSDGLTWVGTKGNGLFMSNDLKQFSHVKFISSDPMNRRKGLVVKCLYEDDDKNVWVSFNEGLYIVLKEANGKYILKRASLFFNSPDLRQINKVYDIKIIGGEIWAGSQQRGLMIFKMKNGEYKRVRHYHVGDQANYLPDDRVSSILVDSKNRKWLGTYKGLQLFQPIDSTFTPFSQLISDSNVPLCDIVLCTHLDNNNQLWFGTPCSLNKITENGDGTYTVKGYTRDNGLPDDYINGILNDESNHIWVSSNSGISRLNPETDEIRNFDLSDGVGGLNFSESACFKGIDGTLFFGGYSDLTYFNPNEIVENKVLPEVVITDFQILNNEVPINDKGILPVSINELKKLTLSHREEEFSIEFAALDYKAPHRNQYKYWLEGFNDDWIYIAGRRHISFSNLKPGDYVLHLSGSNSNGFWNNSGHQLQVKILPPPWKTWYAVLFYVLVLMMVVVLITWIAKTQERLENKIQMEKVMREKEHQMNEYKLKSFTNISHEIRTPLTLILAPANELLKKDFSQLTASYYRDKVQLIQKNTNKLYNLVNQLLEFRKMEAGKVKLEASEQDISEFVDSIFNNFEELAKVKGIKFKKHLIGKNWQCYFNKEKMSVVMNNLISNAIKYAGDPGEVKLELKENDNDIEIKVINNGKGIPEQDIKHLFERFYQASSGKYDMGSSGIGLTLVKNFVELHRGKITVESIPDGLTTFAVMLKKGTDHIKPEEIKPIEDVIEEVVSPDLANVAVSTKSVNTGTKGATVLIVEDNSEVRSYLVDLLGEMYNVLQAEDGLDGFDLVIEHLPQVILSDVMMPRMDGFELCQKIKENDLVSHIPVVLLTAKGTVQDQLFAAKKGADMYITKPFEPELLLEKINQLVASRKILTDKFSKKVILEPKDAEISEYEGDFINQTIQIIEKHIGDFNFDPDKLASELAMSPSTFYRKIKKLTQKTPGKFIKSIRLKRAAQLLKGTDLSVSEIIENVGYMDSKNFRNNFKEAYQMTPLEFRKQSKA